MPEKSLPKTRKKIPLSLPLLGWREWVDLPLWGATVIKSKIDTGAKTSALHVEEIDRFSKNGEAWVRFVIPRSKEHGVVAVEAKLADKRNVKSSIGEVENRYVVETELQIGQHRWRAEITLTDRTRMEFPMLIGRSAITKKFLVDVSKSFVQSAPTATSLKIESRENKKKKKPIV